MGEGIEAYTGRGKVYIRGKAVKANGQQTIVITELPYQVNKARLIEKIAELVREKKLDGGISQDGLRDESDKDGMRIVIELKRGENSEVFSCLYSQTQLQTVLV